MAWDEETFLKRTEGSAIRRTGYQGWLRNIAVALGNSHGGETIEAALQELSQYPDDIVQEHALWALKQLNKTKITAPILTHPRAAKL